MPALPTVTVTDAQLTRLINAFPGSTTAEKASFYRAWLIQKLVEAVLEHELGELEEQYDALVADLDEQKRVRAQEIIDSLKIVT